MINDKMTDMELKALEAFLTESVRPFVRPGQCETAIERLRERFDVEKKTEARAQLLREMAIPLSMIGKHDDAVAVLHQSTDLQPDNPLNWCRLSLIHSTRERMPQPDSESLKAALAAIDKGVEAARRVGALVRYCLNDRCRIAVAMRRYDLLEETLREILALPRPSDIPDIALEDDFLRRVPEGAVDSDLLATYRAAMAEQEARRAKRRSADEP